MHEKALYEYAVIRVLPRVERGEFLNAGVLLYCQMQRYLRASCAVDEARLKAFAPDLSRALLAEHLAAIERICDGGGPIGQLPLGERFRWLTAPRSTIVQMSPVHTGLTCDIEATLENLLDRFVR